MTLFRRWRRAYPASQPVATRGVAFDDSSDFHDDFVRAGAIPPSLTAVAPPSIYRPSVYRELLDSELGDHSRFVGGMGADQAPIQQAPRRRSLTWSRPRRDVVDARRLQPGRVRPFTSQQRIAASWREFNRLRLDPRTATCVRRHTRREVLFAKRIAGRGGGRHGPYRRTLNSQWSC